MIPLLLWAKDASPSLSLHDLEIRDWLALCSVVVSVTALIISVRMALKSHACSIYDAVEAAGNDLLEVQLQYPQFRDKALCDALLEKAANDLDRLRLEAYILKAYNTLETLYEKFGERRLRKSSFLPAMKAIAQRHRKWLYIDDHVDGYKKAMIDFLEANRN